MMTINCAVCSEHKKNVAAHRRTNWINEILWIDAHTICSARSAERHLQPFIRTQQWTTACIWEEKKRFSLSLSDFVWVSVYALSGVCAFRVVARFHTIFSYRWNISKPADIWQTGFTEQMSRRSMNQLDKMTQSSRWCEHVQAETESEATANSISSLFDRLISLRIHFLRHNTNVKSVNSFLPINVCFDQRNFADHIDFSIQKWRRYDRLPAVTCLNSIMCS